MTPYLGGVAIYISFICGIALLFPVAQQLTLLVIGSTLLMILGLLDDLFVFKPYQKFIGQFMAMLCFLKGGIYLKEHIFYNMWNIPISALWIMTIINAFNLIDIMDGLCSTVALGVIGNFMIVACLLNQYELLYPLSILGGSILGFLWYNLPPAKIYMGDAGALFIGGVLGAMPFLFKWGSNNVYGFLTPIILFAIPLLEVSGLIIIRLLKGIAPYQGSPDHFAIYIQSAGFSKNHILMTMFLISIVLGVIASAFVLGNLSLSEIVALGLVFVAAWSFILAKYSPDLKKIFHSR